jgi:hypothetical protein
MELVFQCVRASVNTPNARPFQNVMMKSGFVRPGAEPGGFEGVLCAPAHPGIFLFMPIIILMLLFAHPQFFLLHLAQDFKRLKRRLLYILTYFLLLFALP